MGFFIFGGKDDDAVEPLACNQGLGFGFRVIGFRVLGFRVWGLGF